MSNISQPSKQCAGLRTKARNNVWARINCMFHANRSIRVAALKHYKGGPSVLGSSIDPDLI